jgi:hypothetical protein
MFKQTLKHSPECTQTANKGNMRKQLRARQNNPFMISLVVDKDFLCFSCLRGRKGGEKWRWKMLSRSEIFLSLCGRFLCFWLSQYASGISPQADWFLRSFSHSIADNSLLVYVISFMTFPSHLSLLSLLHNALALLSTWNKLSFVAPPHNCCSFNNVLACEMARLEQGATISFGKLLFSIRRLIARGSRN